MRRMLLALSLAHLAAGLLGTPSHARETLRLKADCPEARPVACLESGLSLESPDPARVSVAIKASPQTSATATVPDIVEHTILVTGRLDNGPLASFRVLSRRETFFEDQYFENIGQVAFLGRSKTNRPIVLTDRGALEIVTPRLDVAYGHSFAVVDERTWRMKREFLELSGDGYVASASDNFSVWKPKQKLCIAAPTRKPGMLQLRKEACPSVNWEPASITTRNMNKLFPYTYVTPPTQKNDPNEVGSKFGGEGNYYQVWRIPKTRTLVITWIHDDC